MLFLKKIFSVFQVLDKKLNALQLNNMEALDDNQGPK